MILLLDIDGVLNSNKFKNKWIRKNPYKRFDHLLDPKAIHQYNLLIDKYKPQVFLVSAWRTNKKALKVLQDHKIYFDGIMEAGADRVSYAVNMACQYPLQTVILLDDDTTCLPKHNRLFLVHTSWARGLKATHIRKINKIMKKRF